jgi:hypothetical protein
VTGLAYARFRWADSRNAAWLSEDPLLDVDSPNLYAFVGWGPHIGTDPMGLLNCLDLWNEACRKGWTDESRQWFEQWSHEQQAEWDDWVAWQAENWDQFVEGFNQARPYLEAMAKDTVEWDAVQVALDTLHDDAASSDEKAAAVGVLMLAWTKLGYEGALIWSGFEGVPEVPGVVVPTHDVHVVARTSTALARGVRVRLTISVSEYGLTPEDVAWIQQKYGIANVRIAAGLESAEKGAGVPYRYSLSRRFVRDTLRPGARLSDVKIQQEAPGMNVDEYVSRHIGGQQVRGNQNLGPARPNQLLGSLEASAIRDLPEGTPILGWEVEVLP